MCDGYCNKYISKLPIFGCILLQKELISFQNQITHTVSTPASVLSLSYKTEHVAYIEIPTKHCPDYKFIKSDWLWSPKHDK